MGMKIFIILAAMQILLFTLYFQLVMDNLNESMDADQEHTFLSTRFSFHERCKSEPSPSTSQTK